MTSFKSKADADRHGRLAHARNAYKNPFGNVCKFKVNGVPCMLKFPTPWKLQLHKRESRHINERKPKEVS